MAQSSWPSSEDPNAAWKILSETQKVLPVTLPEEPQPPNTLRLVCISDTHTLTEGIVIPPGDVLLHAGDFSNVGKPEEVKGFSRFLERQPHKYKVVIAGNHDIPFDLQSYDRLRPRFLPREKMPAAQIKALLTNCTYLEDTGVIIDGIKFWGSPWQPEFYDWGFNLARGAQCAQQWKTIPAGVDVLMTHGPPIGHGDRCQDGFRAGCVDLLREIQTRIHPRIHIFGHIHEGYGVTSDGNTTFINASICNLKYNPVQKPLVIDIALPDGIAPGLTAWHPAVAS